jgi:hypothetical protein
VSRWFFLYFAAMTAACGGDDARAGAPEDSGPDRTQSDGDDVRADASSNDAPQPSEGGADADASMDAAPADATPDVSESGPTCGQGGAPCAEAGDCCSNNCGFRVANTCCALSYSNSDCNGTCCLLMFVSCTSNFECCSGTCDGTGHCQ